MRFVRWAATWAIGNFIIATVLGSTVWFVASVLGKELAYFDYIRNWYIIILAVDFTLDLYKWSSSNKQWDYDMWRRNP